VDQVVVQVLDLELELLVLQVVLLPQDKVMLVVLDLSQLVLLLLAVAVVVLVDLVKMHQDQKLDMVVLVFNYQQDLEIQSLNQLDLVAVD
jgi:hypothetical protein